MPDECSTDTNTLPQSSVSPSSAGESCSTDGAATSALFTHKVTKLDTLPGLAIRYGISVADIKRANGLLSDTAMFGRDTLFIPTKGFPVGEQVQHIFAQLMSGVGRDPTLDAEAQLHPASTAVARIARQLNVINSKSYPDDVPPECPWICQCADFGNMSEDNQAFMSHRHVSAHGFGDVELMRRGDSVHNEETTFMPSAPTGTTRYFEQMRRRRNGGDDGQDSDSGVFGASDGDSAADDYDKSSKPETSGQNGTALHANGRVYGAAHQHPHLLPSQRNGSSSGFFGSSTHQHGSGSSSSSRPLPHRGRPGDPTVVQQFFDWKKLSKTINDSTLVQKIKQAANTPALAGSGRGSFADAAEGVLTSLTALAQKTHSGSIGTRQDDSSASLTKSSSMMSLKAKDGGKQE